jgi:cytoskeletal protein CcmA (bactofilin family)
MQEGLSISPDVRIWGTIHVAGPVQVGGFVDGSITATDVHVSAQAMVRGDIIAKRATIEGQVVGNIFADELVLEPSCNVDGEIYHASLDLREGAQFEGKSRRHDKPRTLAATFSVYEPHEPEA